MSCQEPRQTPLEWEKTVNWWQNWKNQVLKLSEKDFKTGIIKMLQQTIMSSVEVQFKKIENLSKEIESIKKYWMKITELKNTVTKILKTQFMSSIVEWWQKLQSMNLTTE